MAHEIVPIKTPPLYKPETSSRMLDNALELVQRRDDPIGAELDNLHQLLLETRALIGVTLGLAASMRGSDDLPEEVEAALSGMSAVPAKAALELDGLLADQHSYLQMTHLRLIRQYHFLYASRSHLRTAEGFLRDRMVIDPDVSAHALVQVRDSYRNVYAWLQDTYELDGYGLDAFLDGGDADLVEMLFGLRLFQALRSFRGPDWFHHWGLRQWLQLQSHVESGWPGQPKHPIGVEYIMLGDMAMLSHSNFNTQLRTGALFGALAANSNIRPAVLVEALLALMEHPEVGESGRDKITMGFGFALRPVDRRKFDRVSEGLKIALRGT